MAERILSPGVFPQENDQSFTPAGTTPVGAVFIGPTLKGPAFVPTQVTSFTDFTTQFGQQYGQSYIPYAVSSYLKSSGVANIVRVLGDGGWRFDGTVNKIAAIVSGSRILTVFHPTQNTNALANLNASAIAASGSFTSFVLTMSGSSVSKTSTVSLNPTSNNYVTRVFGNTQFVQTGSGYPYLFFNNYFSSSIATTASQYTDAPTMVLNTTSCTFTSSNQGGYQESITPWIISAAGVRLFRLHHISPGFASNTDVKIAVDNISPSTTPGVYSTFSVLVRDYNDTDNVPSIFEQYNNLTLNPNDPTSYVGIAIGNEYSAYSSVQGKVVDHGSYTNNSSYVYLELAPAVDNGSLDATLYPAGFEAVYETITGFSGYSLPSASMVQSSASSVIYSGFDYTNTDNDNYLNPVPQEATQGVNQFFYVNTGDDKFIVPMQGGTDGMSYSIIQNTGGNIAANNLFGFDLSTSTSPGTLSYVQALNILSNQDQYTFNLLVMPGVLNTLHPYVVSYGLSMAQTRGDNLYIVDLCGLNDTIATAVGNVASLDSSYGATYYPWVKIVDSSTNKIVGVPPSVVIPQVFAYSDSVSQEWFAPAGLSRGGIGGVISVVNKLSQSDRDTLYPARINPIASFPNTGICVWGQKTLQIANTALTRINVRRLLINLKNFMVGVAKNLVFEGNTTVTRNTFLNAVNPYLSMVQAQQGVYASKVIMDDTNNTAAVIDQNELVGAIYIQPTKTAEYILLDFNIDSTGATFPS